MSKTLLVAFAGVVNRPRTGVSKIDAQAAAQLDSIVQSDKEIQVVLSRDWKKVSDTVDGVRSACRDFKFASRISGFAFKKGAPAKSNADDWAQWLQEGDRWQRIASFAVLDADPAVGLRFPSHGVLMEAGKLLGSKEAAMALEILKLDDAGPYWYESSGI
ncbi:hypothetical protein HK097_002056 [Rhizophlyctis rosea]|uniref:Uncharacterized protein n=1 Tax=Rhizophlyctis rosea TaxID=64517 RepID=A0AAD5SN15_9FUNG|nr:hypothetical protein HK097_002056 [Rhizophlyctis rosea]